jgi:hypothetical protein
MLFRLTLKSLLDSVGPTQSKYSGVSRGNGTFNLVHTVARINNDALADIPCEYTLQCGAFRKHGNANTLKMKTIPFVMQNNTAIKEQFSGSYLIQSVRFDA